MCNRSASENAEFAASHPRASLALARPFHLVPCAVTVIVIVISTVSTVSTDSHYTNVIAHAHPYIVYRSPVEDARVCVRFARPCNSNGRTGRVGVGYLGGIGRSML